MLRTVVEARALVAMVVAACVGAWGLRTHPVDQEAATVEAVDPGRGDTTRLHQGGSLTACLA